MTWSTSTPAGSDVDRLFANRIGVFGELRFTTEWPVGLVLAVALLGAVLVMAAYLRETSGMRAPWSWGLPAIRGTVFVLACLLVAGPVWHHRQVIGNPATIVWAVDGSASMAERDSQSLESSNRMRRVYDRLFGDARRDGWADDLRTSHFQNVVTFDDRSRLVWSSVEPSNAPEGAADALPEFDPLGDWTDLSAPLRHVADDARLGGDADSPVNGEESRDGEAVRGGRVMVVFSDGRDSAGVADAAEIATRLADAGWQVHTVGVGSVEESPDLGVVDVDVPERVADDGRLAGLIWVKHYGYDGENARVQIRSGDEVVWSDVVDLRGDGKTSVEFDFAVESLMRRAMESDVRGVDRDSVALSLTASVSSVAGPVGADSSPRDSSQSTTSFRGNGSDHSNDSLSFRVAAASRHRRLLILDGSSRWEIRYLRNLFSRDPSWDVNTVLFGLGTDSPKVRWGDEEGRLPDSQRAWAGYDVVIFGEVPPDQWTRQDAMRLTQFVAGGGGMIVLDGRYGRVAELVGNEDGVTHEGTDQPSSSPVRSTSDDVSESMATLIPVRFQRDVNRRPRVQRIVPTVTGKSHPVMMLGLSDSGIEPAAGRIDTEDAFWEHLPVPSSVSRVVAQPDAEIWAEAEFVADAELVSGSAGDRSGNRTPWLVTRVFGAGRVFYLASDETWRWRYKLESRLHGRFWNQLMTAAMSPPYAASDDFVAIGTDRIDYRTGQSATIRARLLPTSSILGDSVTLPTVDALLLKDEQVVATVPMRLENAERRTFVGATDGLPEGEYRVRVRASGFDAAALKASTPIWVTPPRTRERDRLSLDETALQRIAVAGGGIYVHESSAEELLSLIEPISGGQIIESDTPLWQSWWGFAVIVVLLATEWWMRKKVGLI